MQESFEKLVDGRFKKLESIGTGGMGSVFKAMDTMLGRIVALKILHNGILDSEASARFQREGKIVSRLKHQNIVGFYSFGICPDSTPYIAMEYLEGKSLRQILREESTINWKRAVSICLQVCDALSEAHALGVIHRDLKPENIFVLNSPGQSEAKVLDFGLASVMPSSEIEIQRLTATGQLLGSIHYLSPELCSGRKIDHRADIYALGCILYECIIGEPPFVADNAMGVIYKHSHEKLKSFNNFDTAKQLPEGLESIVIKSMMKNPDQRYGCIKDLQKDLSLLLEGRIPELSVASTSSPPVLTTKRIAVLAIVCLAMMLLVLGLKLAEQPGRGVEKSNFELSSVQEVRNLIKKANSGGKVPLEQLAAAERVAGLGTLDRFQLNYFLGQQAPESEKIYYLNQVLSLMPPEQVPPRFRYMELLTLVELSGRLLDLPYWGLKLKNDYCELFVKWQATRLPVHEFSPVDLALQKLQMLNILIGIGRAEKAKQLLSEIKTSKFIPPVEFVTTCLRMKERKLAKVYANACHDAHQLCIMSRFYRWYGLNSDAKECAMRASLYQKGEGLDVSAAMALALISASEIETCLQFLEKTKKHYLVAELSKSEKAELAPFFVSMYMLCDRYDQARIAFEQFRPAADSIDQKRFLGYMEAYFLSSPMDKCAALRKLLKAEGNNSGATYWDLTRVLIQKNLAEDSSIPQELRFKTYQHFVGNVQNEWCLSLPALSFCQRLNSKEHWKDPGVIDWLDSNEARILFRLGRIDEARIRLNKLEKQDCTVELDAGLFSLELEQNELEKARQLIENCKTTDELIEYSFACIAHDLPDLAWLCIKNMKEIQLNAKSRLKLAIAKCYLELETGNIEKAKTYLVDLDIAELKPLLLPESSICHHLLVALVFCGQKEKAGELIRTMRSTK